MRAVTRSGWGVFNNPNFALNMNGRALNIMIFKKYNTGDIVDISQFKIKPILIPSTVDI